MWPVLLVLSLVIESTTSAPTVSAPWGKIQGVDKVATNGKSYSGYYGIPFAEPPVGNLRFRKPRAHPGVTSTFNANIYGPQCQQVSYSISNDTSQDHAMSEDCLTLNVFVPSPGGTGKTVMVWIHGGAFVQGAAYMYEPWKLVTETDVIVVTTQYRLGVFGFLTTGNDLAPGNLGLRDQALALEWVQKNIQAFGGDPQSVTAFGESAGGASISLHSLSPRSKGLFKRFIVQSGSPTAFWADISKYREIFNRVAVKVGCPGITSNTRAEDTEAVECLRKLSTDVLTPLSITGVGGPIVDGDFMPDHPRTLLQNSTYLSDLGFYDLDGMIGVNNMEGGIILSFQLILWEASGVNVTTAVSQINSLENYNSFVIPSVINHTYGDFDPTLADIVSWHYTYPRADNGGYLDLDSVVHTYGDSSFLSPAVQYARYHSARAGGGKTYFYYFNHYPAMAAQSLIKGMNHGGDLLYTFGVDQFAISYLKWNGIITQAEHDLSDVFVELQADFAKTGNPDPAVQGKLGMSWAEFDPEDEHYLSFTTNMTLKQHLAAKRVSLWLDLLPMILKKRHIAAQTTHDQTGSSCWGFGVSDSWSSGTLSHVLVMAISVIVSSVIVLTCNRLS